MSRSAFLQLKIRILDAPGCAFGALDGDPVSWNSEAGRVRGTIIKVHTKDVDYKGYIHHASTDEPQHEIASDKTAHVAMHKAQALNKVKH